MPPKVRKYPAISPPYDSTWDGVDGGTSLCRCRYLPPQPTATTREMRLGIQVQRSQKWRAL